MFKSPEEFRSTKGKYATTKDDGCRGIFFIPLKKNRFIVLKDNVYGYARCASDNSQGWERVSISIVNVSKEKSVQRYPTLEEIKIVRQYFWDKSDYIAMFIGNQSPMPKEGEVLFANLCKKIGSIYEVPHALLV